MVVNHTHCVHMCNYSVIQCQRKCLKIILWLSGLFSFNTIRFVLKTHLCFLLLCCSHYPPCWKMPNTVNLELVSKVCVLFSLFVSERSHKLIFSEFGRKAAELKLNWVKILCTLPTLESMWKNRVCRLQWWCAAHPENVSLKPTANSHWAGTASHSASPTLPRFSMQCTQCSPLTHRN